jgi:hypothetical protein
MTRRFVAGRKKANRRSPKAAPVESTLLYQ